MRRILIAESHPVARTGYRQLLETAFGLLEFVEASSRQALLDALDQGNWDLVLLDLALQHQPGMGLVQEVRARFPAAPILVVSSYSEDLYAGEALRAGAAGFVSKASSAETLIQAVTQVLSGRRYVSPAFAEQMLNKFIHMPGPLHEQLSPRERQVFGGLAVGQSITSIAAEMGLSVKTVSTYRARILEKMSMRSNADITAYALRLGIAEQRPVPDEPPERTDDQGS